MPQSDKETPAKPTSSLLSSLLPNWKSSTIPENAREESALNSDDREPDPNLPVSLEGTLLYRKSKSLRQKRNWKQCYVVLDLADGGSMACYKQKPATESAFEQKGTKSKSSRRSARTARSTSAYLVADEDSLPTLHLPGHINWVAKDIENNSTGFLIEISSVEPTVPFFLLGEGVNSSLRTSENLPIPEELKEDINQCRERGDPLRIYFRCARSGNEKLLWLRAFEQVNRLSFELHRKKGLKNFWENPNLQFSHRRLRSNKNKKFAEEGKLLGDNASVEAAIDDDPGEDLRLGSKHGKYGEQTGEKEYLVYPLYAYPNRWMTESELYEEMMKPSDHFFDLRVDNPAQKEIGVLKVELLQCCGLPALDFASETDAVAYLVCGSYAFASDVIWNRLNPRWLPRSRRACIFPLFHAYARLFAGVFDDDGKGEKDDFAGRAIVDLARLRPRSTYDVTFPLRVSSHVYSKKSRGAIRLRFSVEWHSERDALLSYIPKKMQPPTVQRPDDDVTVLCADEKAFRNIATTVHSIHMPGRFSFAQWRATMREGNFARKVAQNAMMKLIKDIIWWQNPALSFLVFTAWMHCIYKNAFSLVPFYFMCFLLLMMIRSYVLFGSDGPIQEGFVPPSFEEMFHALIKSKDSKVIKPLSFKPKRTYKSLRMRVTAEPVTHKQRFKLFFRLLGFPNSIEGAKPEDYNMEFPYAQGLRDPLTDEVAYPKFTVRESLVEKSSLIGSRGKKKSQDDDDDGGGGMLGEFMTPQNSKKVPRKVSLDLFSSSKKRPSLEETVGKTTKELQKQYEDLPPSLRIPEQNASAKGPAKKKKLGDELAELSTNMHKMTCHVFNDRTHVVKHPEATYFGYARKGVYGNVDNDLERLLNIGQYSSANPVVARVGLYVEPIISAALSGLCATRAVYNVITWRDPILSFWVTLLIAILVVVLAIFPWRLFLFAVGFLVLGPQNWALRIMEERGTTPKRIKTFIEDRKKKQQERKAKTKAFSTELPNQPIISCHTSDNAPPPHLMHGEVDAREIHAVSVPYSQLMYHRMYDWPPEPQYAKCEPTVEVEKASSNR